MLNARACLLVVVLSVIELGAAGCGGDSDSGGDGDAPAKDDATSQEAEPEAPVIKTIVAKPLDAEEDLLVMQGPDGQEMTFKVRPEDARAVDPTHVASHVGIPNLAFEITYE